MYLSTVHPISSRRQGSNCFAEASLFEIRVDCGLLLAIKDGVERMLDNKRSSLSKFEETV